jgi:hypothetical protein
MVRDWGDCLEKNYRFRDLVERKNKVELLPESPDRNIKLLEVHSGRAGGVIDHASGLLMSMPTFHADPMGLDSEERRDAEQVERFDAAVFEQQLLANDFWPAIGRDILVYGRSYLKSMLMESQWTFQEGYPARGQKEKGKDYRARVRRWKETEAKFPFVLSHVPALNILTHLDAQDNVLASIEEKAVTAEILADEFESKTVQESLRRKNIRWYDELTVIEYIDRDWVAYYLVDDLPIDKTQDRRPFDRVKSYKPLRAWRHNMGMHPVVMIPGTVTGSDKYEDRFKGFLEDAEDPLELYDFLLSRLASMVYAYYLPSYVFYSPMTSQTLKGRRRPKMKVNLAGVTVLMGDEKLLTLEIPQGLPDATMLLQQCDDLIQRHTIEDVLFGRVVGSAPAFQVNLRINVAKSKLTPLAQHMAQGLTAAGERIHRGVEILDEAVIVDGERLTTTLATEYRNRLAVQIEPKSPVEQSQDIGAAAMAMDLGLPRDWVWEQILNIEDPATLSLMKDIQDLEELPQVKERLMQDALEHLEILVDEDEMLDASGIDMSEMTPEVQAAMTQLLGGGPAGELGEFELPPLEGGGGGAAPAPPGASPQALGGGRGLATPNAQPMPGAVSAGDLAQLALSGGIG